MHLVLKRFGERQSSEFFLLPLQLICCWSFISFRFTERGVSLLTSDCFTGLRKKSSAPCSKHLFILDGTFSDDMITTGISLKYEDPCKICNHVLRFRFLKQKKKSNKLRKLKQSEASYLYFSQEIITGQSRHWVISNYHVYFHFL